MNEIIFKKNESFELKEIKLTEKKLELIENKNQNFKKKNLKNEYYDISASTIINKIMINYKNNTLEQIERKITYKPNPRMNNKKYMQLIEELTDNINAETIINNVNSILDLIDIFDYFNIPSIELNKIFNTLNIVEIMALKNYYSLNDSYIIKKLDNYIANKKEKIIILNNYKNIIIEYI